jgi:hypothetical protein
MAVTALLLPSLARASTSIYVLSIGYNGAPAGSSDNEAALHYADDDAAAFYRFWRDFSRDGRLLTVMDADTQSRFPAEVSRARVPSLSQLRADVQAITRKLEEDRKHGDDSAVLVFYSGHGVRPNGGVPGLTLFDGVLTHDVLYDEVLSALPARYVHLFVDACYAEAIVRPRDADAPSVDVTRAELVELGAKTTLARFPNVGAIVGASSSSRTHEWDVYRQGVFTHELLSGLRGGADVNADGKIEYSELYAFLAAANRDVTDSRARLSVVARAPSSNVRAAIVDLNEYKARARLVRIPASAGQLYVEDQFGNRLADLRVEVGATVDLTLPAETKLFVRTRANEAELVLHTAQTLAFDELAMSPPTARIRGIMEVAMQRGLFATAFGPSYYRGFIDRTSGLVTVPLEERSPTSPWPDIVATNPYRAAPDGLALYVAAGASQAVTPGISVLPTIRAGLRPSEPTGFLVSVDVAVGQSTVAEGRALASLGYRLGLRTGRFAASLAGVGGVGFAWQKAASNGVSAGTAIVAVAPTAATTYMLTRRVGAGFEASFTTFLYRVDGETKLSPFLPGAFLGVVTEL